MSGTDRMHDRARLHRLALGGAWLLLLAALVPNCSEVPPVRAQEQTFQGVHLRAVGGGTLLFRTDPRGSFQPATRVKADVHLHVTGLVARATVRQEFKNPSAEWAEGIYVFPLPADAAVDHMRVWVGERVIEGQIEERQRAKKRYVEAKRAGKRAALLEQERPNIFTASVANIGPGAGITVEIEYQQTVRYDQGRFRLRFPMVIGPRFIPGTPLAVNSPVPPSGGSGWAFDTDQVPDAARITSPVQHPDGGSINPLILTVDLAPGFPLSHLASTHHEIEVTEPEKGRHVIRLTQGHVPADRDFELVWRPARGNQPRAAAFVERKNGLVYGLFMLLPPEPEAVEEIVLLREVIFVIDTSGSMHGISIRQAKAALSLALERLSPNDRFNIIQFNTQTHALFDSTRPATKTNVLSSLGYVRSLHASGGTVMLPAMRRALAGAEDTTRLRQVVFLTDGQIGNEAALFRTIKQRLGRSRLFTIGIGSAPNGHFMQRAALFGRGTFTYIGKIDEVGERVDGLLQKLDHAALTDIEIERAGWEEADFQPDRIPDLYQGEPVVVAVRSMQLPDRIKLQGRIGDRLWQTELRLAEAESRTGVSVYWARQKIASLMNRQAEPGAREMVRQAVVDLAMRHHLVSKFTSLVAVDVTPVRPQEMTLNEHAVKTNLPFGQDYTAIFGLPQTATMADARILLGLVLLLLAGTVLYLETRRC